jgi:hypothetical protein
MLTARLSERSGVTMTAILLATTGLAVAAFVALAVFTVTSGPAEATPQFAQQTKMPCGQCHSNPGGGGKLKPFGQKFKEKGNRL